MLVLQPAWSPQVTETLPFSPSSLHSSFSNWFRPWKKWSSLQSHFLLSGNCPKYPKSHVLSTQSTARTKDQLQHLPYSFSLKGVPSPHTWYYKTAPSLRRSLLAFTVLVSVCTLCPLVLIHRTMNSVEKHPSAERTIEYVRYQLGYNFSSLIIHV